MSYCQTDGKGQLIAIEVKIGIDVDADVGVDMDADDDAADNADKLNWMLRLMHCV